jgi:hypothetical protein
MVRETNVVIESLTDAMLRRGWSIRHVVKLPEAYTKNTPITPYFYCSYAHRKSAGRYVIDGAVGVIDQIFEEAWEVDPENTSKEGQFGMTLHIANVKELNDARFLPGAELELEVDNFALTISRFLDGMPQNVSELISSFRSNEMRGFSIEKYSGYSGRQKFGAFKRYMETMVASGM